jgi:hypothetical protein
VSSILLSISILWRQRTHNSSCIMGGGDSYGADNVVDTGTEIVNDDLVAMYLDYYDA